MLDGLRQDLFEDKLARGRLPELQRLIDEGAYVRDGVSSFPSVTGYAFCPFLTGLPAARSGVLGLRWLDRTRAEGNFRNYVGRWNTSLNGDLRPDVPTLFEYFPNCHSSVVDSYVSRGCKAVHNDGVTFTLSKYARRWWLARGLRRLPRVGARLVPDYVTAGRGVMELAIRDLDARPKIQWVTLPHLDAINHVEGTTENYVEQMHVVDRSLGAFRARSRALDIECDRIYVVVSDHGVVDVHKHTDLARALTRMGIPADRDVAAHVWTPRNTRPLAHYDRHAAIVAVNGNLMCHVYLRKPGASGAGAWHVTPTRAELGAYPTRGGAIDVVRRCAALEGISLVIVREDANRIGVYNRSGRSEVHVMPDGLAYRVLEGDDPLAYARDPALSALADGRPRDARAWLAATHRSQYPDAPRQLAVLMSVPDAGDLVVTSETGYDLTEDFEALVGNYCGGHGALGADQMRVPFILAGPGIRKGARVPYARAEDVAVTLMHLLGITPPTDADGVVLDVVEECAGAMSP
jgi:hypothetical protein